MNYPEFEKAVEALVDAAYDSGYYSGQLRDGEPLHKDAIARREYARKAVLKAYRQLCEELDDAILLSEE